MNVKMFAVALVAAAALTTTAVGGDALAGSFKGPLGVKIGGLDRDHDRDRDRHDHDHDRYRFGGYYEHFDHYDYDDGCYFVRRFGHIVRICPDIY